MSDEPAKLSLKLRPPPSAADPATPEAPATAAEPAAPAATPGTAPNLAAHRVQKVALGIGLGGLLVFVGVGFIAFPRLMAQTRALADAQARFQAEEVAAMRAARAEQDAARTPPPATVPAPAKPAVATAQPVASVAAASTPIAAPAVVDGDEAFRSWVTSAKIGGVREGRVVRILIGHSAYSLGDIVDPALGVRFDSYDASSHTVRFRDATGHTLERRDW